MLGFACGTTDDPGTPKSSDSSSLEVRDVPPHLACAGGATSPVQVEEVIRVFRIHDLEMFDDPECSYTESERQASNAPFFGPNPRRGDAYDDVARAQGDIHCGLFAASSNPLRPVKEIKYEGDKETRFLFGNVSCTIYPDSASEQEQVDRLRKAVSDLARRVGERE